MIIGNCVDKVCFWGSNGRIKCGLLYQIGGAQLKFTPKPQCVNGRSQSAMEVVQFSSKGMHLLEETDEQKLSERILMLSRSNKVRSAMSLFRSMRYTGLIPNQHACNSLLASLLRKKYQIDDALEVFEFMKSNEITTPHTYSLMLKAVADTEGFDSAFGMYGTMEEKDFDVVVYNTVISICGKTNDWDRAKKVWRTMNERECLGSEVTYSLLVSIFGRCGKNELAFSAYNEMRRNGLRNSNLIEAVIVLYAKEGKWDLALENFQEILNDGMMKCPSLDTCHALMKSLGLAGKVERAFWVFECLEMLGHKPNSYTFNALLKALYWGNRHSDVIRLFEVLLETKERSLIDELAYRTALLSCRRLGLSEKAVQILWKMEGSCEVLVLSVCYNLVIGACEKGGNADVALRVYERMVQQECSPDRYTYLSLVRVCISRSMWSEVEGILDQVAADKTLYTAVMNAMCSSGNLDAARKLNMKIQTTDIAPNAKT